MDVWGRIFFKFCVVCSVFEKILRFLQSQCELLNRDGAKVEQNGEIMML